jgi:hypothetical protein
MYDTINRNGQYHYVNGGMHPLFVLKAVVDKRADIKNTQSRKSHNGGGCWLEIFIIRF